MLQEAASAEHTAALQEELEQLHTSAGHMKVHLEAAQQSQLDAQVPGCFVDACNVLSFHHDLVLFVLFCFVLFCFVLFCFVLFCFVLFCFVLISLLTFCVLRFT